MECLTVNSIRHAIGLQWKLRVKDILPDSITGECDYSLDIPEKKVRSHLCRIKGTVDLIFYLEINSQLNLLAKGNRGWSYQLIYAFAVVKERAFLVVKNDQLEFLECLQLNHLDSVEEVELHCLILTEPCAADSISDDPDLTEGQSDTRPVCLTMSPDWKFDGKIPEFTIDKAEKLITNESTNNVMKVLAMEYLIKNIKAESVSDILKIAIDQDLKILQKHCSEFLSGCNIRQKKLSLSSSSSSDSSDSESGDNLQIINILKEVFNP